MFVVSAKSMQCSYDPKGNSVPIILLLMQDHLYSQGSLKVLTVYILASFVTPSSKLLQVVTSEFNTNYPFVLSLQSIFRLRVWFV